MPNNRNDGGNPGAANGGGAPFAPDAEVMVGAGGAGLVRIDFFPEEVLDGTVARGRFYVYVRGQLQKQYDACGGPPADQAHADRGGHYAAPTVEGGYLLGAAEHYTTQSWPTSTVPWGAQLRLRDDQEIEFSSDGGTTWLPATGLSGCVTRSWIAFEQRTRASAAAQQNAQHKNDPGFTPIIPQPLSSDDIATINKQGRNFFFSGGVLAQSYVANDFGKWAWSVNRQDSAGFHRTGMFVHTTPRDEAATAAGQPVSLTDSHGCIHIRPVDRDEMMNLGYLQRGVHFVVKKYGVKGP